MDGDNILQGFLVAGFSLIGISAIFYCVRLRMKTTTLKHSSSMEELNSVGTADPV